MTLDGHAATLARSLVHPSALPAAGSAAAAATPSMYRWSMTRGGRRRSCLPTRNQSKGIAIRPSRVCGSIRTYWLRNGSSPPRWLRGFQEALLPSSLCPGIPGDWKSPNEPSHRTSLGSVADAEVRRQRPEVVVGGRAAQRALTAPRLSLRPSLSCCYCVHVRSTTFLRLASPPSLMLTL